ALPIAVSAFGNGQRQRQEDVMRRSAFLFVSGCTAMLMANLPTAQLAFAQEQQQQASVRDAAMVLAWLVLGSSHERELTRWWRSLCKLCAPREIDANPKAKAFAQSARASNEGS